MLAAAVGKAAAAGALSDLPEIWRCPLMKAHHLSSKKRRMNGALNRSPSRNRRSSRTTCVRPEAAAAARKAAAADDFGVLPAKRGVSTTRNMVGRAVMNPWRPVSGAEGALQQNDICGALQQSSTGLQQGPVPRVGNGTIVHDDGGKLATAAACTKRSNEVAVAAQFRLTVTSS